MRLGIITVRIEEEDIYFLYKLNYLDLDKNYFEIIRYCLRFSDSFSVITQLKKPYSKGKIVDEHSEILAKWDSCLVKRIVGIRKWPGTETRDTHNVMNIYSSRGIRKNIVDLPNLFSSIGNNLPEDICFYRNDAAWLVTISHEREAFLRFATKDDLDFLTRSNVRYYE